MPDRRELYHSANGDTWFLGREPQNGHAFIGPVAEVVGIGLA